jgi:hypothetical protein
MAAGAGHDVIGLILISRKKHNSHWTPVIYGIDCRMTEMAAGL